MLRFQQSVFMLWHSVDIIYVNTIALILAKGNFIFFDQNDIHVFTNNIYDMNTQKKRKESTYT